MPATSEKQQRAMGMALAAKQGKIPESKLSDKIKKMMDSMSEKELKDFASTKYSEIKKASSLEYDPKQALINSATLGLGGYGSILGLNQLERSFDPESIANNKIVKALTTKNFNDKIKSIPFGLKHKINNLEKEINAFDNFLESKEYIKHLKNKGFNSKFEKVKDAYNGSKLHSKLFESSEVIQSKRDLLSSLKDLFQGKTKTIMLKEQGSNEAVNSLLGNRITSKLIGNKQRHLLPGGVTYRLGFYCPVGRRTILSGLLATLGLTAGGLSLKNDNKKEASLADNISIGDAIGGAGIGAATTASGLGILNKLDERNQVKALKDILSDPKASITKLKKVISSRKFDALASQIPELTGKININFAPSGATWGLDKSRAELEKSLKGNVFSDKINNAILNNSIVKKILNSKLISDKPNKYLLSRSPKDLINSIAKRVARPTPLSALLGAGLLLPEYNNIFSKKLASTESNKSSINYTLPGILSGATKGAIIGGGGTAMANELLGDYFPAIVGANYNRPIWSYTELKKSLEEKPYTKIEQLARYFKKRVGGDGGSIVNPIFDAGKLITDPVKSKIKELIPDALKIISKKHAPSTLVSSAPTDIANTLVKGTRNWTRAKHTAAMAALLAALGGSLSYNKE